MSQQSTLDKFFVKKANKNSLKSNEEIMSNVKSKKLNLSLTRVSTTPSKVKSERRLKEAQDIVDLCDDDSDEDNFQQNNLKSTQPIKCEWPSTSVVNSVKEEIDVKPELCSPKRQSSDNNIVDTSDSTIEYSLTPENQNQIAKISKPNKRSHEEIPQNLKKRKKNEESDEKDNEEILCSEVILSAESLEVILDDNVSSSPEFMTPIKIEQTISQAPKSNGTSNKASKTVKEESQATPQTSNLSVSNVSFHSTPPITQTPNSTVSNQSSPQTPHVSKPDASPVIVCVKSSTKNPNKLTYFSPSKKRSVVKKTANARRNLNTELSILDTTQGSTNFILEEAFTIACDGMDDKTIFLLKVIHKYLKDESLHPLLDSTSHGLLCKCLHVIKPGMRIVCRLYWKKEGWYKQEDMKKLATDFSESDELINNVLESLIETGLIVKGDSNSMAFDDYTSILNKEEIVQICKDLNIKIASKQEAIKKLLKFSKTTSNISNYFTGKSSSNSSRLLMIMCEKAGLCYKMSELARSTLYRLFVMMYLGMNYELIREKRLELTLIYENIGRETYPVDKEMELDSASVIFSSRDEFESYIAAHTTYEDYIQRSDVLEKCEIIIQAFELYKSIGEEQMSRYKSLPCWLRRYTPADIYIKLLEQGVKELKKDPKYFELAIMILDMLITQDTFRQHNKAEWYAEKALILHSHFNWYSEAALVLLEGFDSDLSDAAKDTLRPRARKIANQKSAAIDQHLKDELSKHYNTESILEANLGGEHIYKVPLERFKNRGKVKFETKTVDGRLVQEAEEYCIAHYLYSGKFTNGEHWEGRIVTTIFYLLFWDVIYSKPANVKGVFLSHYQQFPLDLFTESFYTNRKTAIDDFLTFIENATIHILLGIMQERWDQRPETELSGINRSIGWSNVAMVTKCLGPRGISAICRHLAENYRYRHSGFPDLTLWNRETNHIKFVEVKTDSDKPSMKQIQWMHFLKANNIDTEFCYVGVNTTRQKSRKSNAKKTTTPRKATPTQIYKTEPGTSIKEEVTSDSDDFQASSIVKVEIDTN